MKTRKTIIAAAVAAVALSVALAAHADQRRCYQIGSKRVCDRTDVSGQVVEREECWPNGSSLRCDIYPYPNGYTPPPFANFPPARN